MYEVILTSSPDGPITAYDASTGATVAQFTGSRSPCRGITVAGQGLIAASHVFSDTGTGSIHIFNWYTSTVFHNIPVPEPVAPLAATVAQFTGSRSPCRGITVAGQGLIAASHVFSDTGTGSIHIFNWYTSTVFHNIPVPEPVAPLAATSDGVFLFAGGVSWTVHSLSLPSGDLIKSFPFHSKPVSSLHISDDGSLVFSGSDDGTIVVIPSFNLVETTTSLKDQNKDLILHKWKAHSDSITAFNTGIGLSGSTLVSCSLDCTCKFWSLGSEIILTRTVTFPCAVFGFVMDSTESGFYAGGADGFVYKGLMKVGSRKMLGLGKGYELMSWGGKSKSHGGSIVSLCLVNEGKNLVSAREDGSVYVWDVAGEGEVVMVLGNDKMGRVIISDMIVAKGNNGWGVTKGNTGGEGSGFTSSGLCDGELIRTLKLITELGDVTDVVVKDKRRAIDMLESAIAMYERLLRLILEEATKAIEEAKEEEKEDIA